MSLIKPGFGIATLSGKLGGTVYARNRGGLYAKAWTSPDQPDTPDQTDKRQIWTDAADHYAGLSAEQIDLWQIYARQLTASNRLGDPIQLTAQQVFWELFTNATLIGATPLDVPTQFTNRPALQGSGELVATSNGTELSRLYIIDVTAITPSEAPAKLLLYAAPITRPTIRNVNKYLRLIGAYDTSTGDIDFFDQFKDKFSIDAEPGQLAHLAIRAIDTTSMLGSTRLLRMSVVEHS